MHIEKLGELFNKWFQPIQATLKRVFVPQCSGKGILQNSLLVDC